MTIEKTLNGTEITVAVAGRLDTITAPELETSLRESYAALCLFRLRGKVFAVWNARPRGCN